MNKTPLIVLKDTAPAWAKHFNRWHGCLRCDIGRYAKHHVFVRGQLPCDILFLGEAPGDTEDATGYPFSGSAGALFNVMIETALEETMPRWAVTNMVLCRPADSALDRFRAPSPEEKSNCRERLDELIQTIATPKAIVCMGKHASSAAPFQLTRGNTIPVLDIYHPSYILRNGGYVSERGRKIFDGEVAKLKTFIGQLTNL